MNTARVEGEAKLLQDPFVLLENWVDHIVFQRSTINDLVVVGQINCLLLSKPLEDGVLADRFIEITILEVFIGNIHEKMTYQKWPILDFGFSGDYCLSEMVNHFF